MLILFVSVLAQEPNTINKEMDVNEFGSVLVNKEKFKVSTNKKEFGGVTFGIVAENGKKINSPIKKMQIYAEMDLYKIAQKELSKYIRFISPKKSRVIQKKFKNHDLKSNIDIRMLSPKVRNIINGNLLNE